MTANAYPIHELLSNLPADIRASDTQYESAVNAFLARAFNSDGTLKASAVWRSGSIRYVAYSDLTDDLKDGWLSADGTIYNVATYPALFGRIGKTYGGDGITTFGVPNIADRVVVGFGTSATLGAALGATGGAVNHTHTGPAHTHDQGTLTVNSHTHGVGTLAETGHTHGAGSLSAASHVHTLSNITVQNESSHTHTIGTHTHTYTTDQGSNEQIIVDEGAQDQVSLASHTHTGTTDAGGTSPTDAGSAHTHALTGNVDASGALAVTGTSGSTAAGLTGSTAAASPGVTGNTGSSGTGATGPNNQAYIVLKVLIKT